MQFQGFLVKNLESIHELQRQSKWLMPRTCLKLCFISGRHKKRPPQPQGRAVEFLWWALLPKIHLNMAQLLYDYNYRCCSHHFSNNSNVFGHRPDNFENEVTKSLNCQKSRSTVILKLLKIRTPNQLQVAKIASFSKLVSNIAKSIQIFYEFF